MNRLKINGNNGFWGIGLKILSGLCFAIMMGMIKYLGEAIPLGEIVFFRSAVALLDGWVTSTLEQWLLLIGIGLTGGIARIFMTLAYQYTDASALAPYEYLSIIWAVFSVYSYLVICQTWFFG